MRFILATYYDGTLKCGGNVSEENLAAISKFREKGNLFGVVTGRGYPSHYNEYLDFTIGFNGAVDYDKDFKMLFSQTADGSIKWRKFTFVLELIKRLIELTNAPAAYL